MLLIVIIKSFPVLSAKEHKEYEKLHRLLLKNYDKFIEEYSNERDELEKDFIVESKKLDYDSKEELYEFSLNCFKRSTLFLY